MPHYCLERMLCGIVIEEELIAVFAHLPSPSSFFILCSNDSVLKFTMSTLSCHPHQLL